jgi:hypothetical protein
MLTQRIDILSFPVLSKADAICFCSNGIVRKNNALVMGAGVAKAFRDRFTGLDFSAGAAVRKNGNICQVICLEKAFNNIFSIIAFPTKYHWKDSSDLRLIEKSARELMALVKEYGWSKVALPVPGCKCGGLSYKDVKPVIEPILDNRVVLVYL